MYAEMFLEAVEFVASKSQDRYIWGMGVVALPIRLLTAAQDSADSVLYLQPFHACHGMSGDWCDDLG